MTNTTDNEQRTTFRAPGAKHRDRGLPDGGIPTTCPRCGHSVTWWNEDYGHAVPVRCDDPRLASTTVLATPEAERDAMADEYPQSLAQWADTFSALQAESAAKDATIAQMREQLLKVQHVASQFVDDAGSCWWQVGLIVKRGLALAAQPSSSSNAERPS